MAKKRKDESVEQTVEAQAPQEQNVQISIEQICAAILATNGLTKVKLEDLVADYSKKTIMVNQLEDGSITFELIDAPEVNEDAEQISE